MNTLLTLAAGAPARGALAYGADPAIPWGRIVLAFLLCLALALGAIAVIRARHGLAVVPPELARRLSHGTAAPVAEAERIAIVQRLAVTPTSQLVVLRRGSRSYLLHLTAQGATEIDRFDDSAAEGEA